MFWVLFILGLSVFTLVTCDCLIPSLPKDGFFMTCGTLSGSICQVYCRYNNKILMKKCSTDGTWVGDSFNCSDDDDDCDKTLKAPENGSIVGVCNKNYGSVCIFKCNTGYDLVGSVQVYCLGQWTASEPTCVKAGAANTIAKCSVLNPPINGHLDGKCYQGSPVGSVCYFVCSTGYFLVGSSSAICLANGQWSSSTPFCNKLSTTTLPNISFNPSSNLFSIPNSFYIPTSNPNPNPFSIPNSFSIPTSSPNPNPFSIPNLFSIPSSSSNPNPFSIPNSFSIPTSNPNPNPFSIPNSFSIPSTKPTSPGQKQTSSSGTCTSMKQVENGRLKGDCQPGIVSRKCSVVCSFGYYSKGSKSITCLNNGQWSGKLASCKRARYLLVQTVYW